jgi:hypothetical protein
LQSIQEEWFAVVRFRLTTHITEGDGKPDGPPDQATQAGVQNIFQKDVFRVLRANRSGLKQRKTALRMPRDMMMIYVEASRSVLRNVPA